MLLMDETHCTFVGSFGLLKSTSHKSDTPISDSDDLNTKWYSNIYPHCVVHVCPQAIPNFISKVLPLIQVPFKLVTNNSDCTIPDDFQTESDILLHHPLLEKWFAQNCVGSHPKFVKIPIGLDYHSLCPNPNERKRMIWEKKPQHHWGVKKYPLQQEHEIITLKTRSKPFYNRKLEAYANFQFTMWTRYGKVDRQSAMDTVPIDLVFYEPTKVTRDICWKHMIENAFVLSPHGNGLDCHRTWEALCLGCIPIIKSSGIDSLFEDLPVWIVDDWKEVTADSMKRKIDEFKVKQFKYEKLTLSYWKDQITYNQ